MTDTNSYEMIEHLSKPMKTHIEELKALLERWDQVSSYHAHWLITQHTYNCNLQLSGGPFGPVITRVSAGLRGPPVISEIRCPPPSGAPHAPAGGRQPPSEGCAAGALTVFSRAHLGKKRYRIAPPPGGISYRGRLILPAKFRLFF